MEDDLSPWIVDLGATNHVCSSLQMLTSSRELADRDVAMRVGSGEVVSAKIVGVARLNFRNKFLVLHNVFFILVLRKILFLFLCCMNNYLVFLLLIMRLLFQEMV